MFLNPEDTMKHLLIREDWHIADFGAGSGSYTLAASQYAPTGKVYAIDINRDILPLIAARVFSRGRRNVEVMWGDIDRAGGTGLQNASMDAVIASNVFFQLENKNACIGEIKRIVKPGGKVFFIDWSGSFGNMGPQEEDIMRPETIKTLFGKFGFEWKKDVPAGEYHYGMIFFKQ